MSHGKETSSWEVFEKVQLAIASKCRQLSTRPLRIFRVECIGGAAGVSNWVTITMRRRQHAGECVRRGEAIPLPKLYVAGQVKNYVLS